MTRRRRSMTPLRSAGKLSGPGSDSPTMESDPTPRPIHARALCKSFGLQRILRRLDLDVEAGECLALLGANGAGKTTLLRLLAGITRPSSGDLEIFGVSCSPDRPPSELSARIGFVGHEPLVYRDLTPRQNLDFFARLYAVEDRETRVTQALERFALERWQSRDVRALSRGTLQRLALARATLHDPQLLFLDEAFTGLDAVGQERLREELRAAAARGCSIVLVSHDLGEVADLATRAVVLRGGRLIDEISPVPDLPELTARYRAAIEEGATHVVDPS